MIRTLSTNSSNTSCSSNEHPSPSNQSRRSTLHSIARRLSDSKKNLLEHIPHHQEQLTSFRKRAKSFFASNLIEHLSELQQSTSQRRNSTTAIVSVDEIYRRIHSTHGNKRHLYENSFAPPKFLQPSTLIDDDQAKQILLEIPARYHGLDWCMLFSTEAHGFSLNQLYRQALQFDHDLPSLLIIRDVEQNTFGAFVPRPLMLSHGFYGTGESFLFTFSPEFRVYNWSGLNEFYVKGDLHSLGFGSGDGVYGLWIDGDLYRGRTSPSKTFNNEPLTPREDFIIASIEVWTFTD